MPAVFMAFRFSPKTKSHPESSLPRAGAIMFEVQPKDVKTITTVQRMPLQGMPLQRMIDIHCHVLPETDDGSTSLEESVAMCRMAAEDGIKTIVATPHLFDGMHAPPSRDDIRRKIDLVMEASGGVVEIIPGGETRYSHEIFQEARDKQTRMRLNGSSYMLLEFDFMMVPPNIEMTIFQILQAGIMPVIAHPERNARIQLKPEILANLIERGAYAQIDAGSLTGSFGKECEASARQLIRAGLAHFLASDGHHQDRRRPLLSKAVSIAAEVGGERYAQAMVEDNPLALIQDRGIPFQPDPDLDVLRGQRKKKKEKSWFAFWR
jgi:protein-tyrosine phosphatase